MEGSGTTRGNSVQLVHIQDGGGAEAVRGTAVDVGGEFDVIVQIEGLQRYGVGLEVFQHGRDAGEGQMLHLTAFTIHCQTQVLHTRTT